MNKKSLLLVFSIVAVASCGLMGEKKTQRTPAETEEIKNLLWYHFGSARNPFDGCAKTGSDNCDFVIKHLKNAKEHQKKQAVINELTNQMSRLSSEQTKRPVK